MEQVRGILIIDRLKSGDRILISEACSHHPIEDDIGTVKLPAWLEKYAGGRLEFDYVRGHSFPEDLSSYRLIIHCGACMWNRREMLSRIHQCQSSGVPITNYGLVIACVHGILDRALEPFPDTLELYRTRRTRSNSREQNCKGEYCVGNGNDRPLLHR